MKLVKSDLKDSKPFLVDRVVYSTFSISETVKSNSTSMEDEKLEEQKPPRTRQPLYLSKSKPIINKLYPRVSAQSNDVVSSDIDNWEALSEAGSSTRWRSSNGSLGRPVHHICPLSENTLLNGYESESPDEVTLVKTACKYGCKLLQRGLDFVIIWLPGMLTLGWYLGTHI